MLVIMEMTTVMMEITMKVVDTMVETVVMMDLKVLIFIVMNVYA